MKCGVVRKLLAYGLPVVTAVLIVLESTDVINIGFGLVFLPLLISLLVDMAIITHFLVEEFYKDKDGKSGE